MKAVSHLADDASTPLEIYSGVVSPGTRPTLFWSARNSPTIEFAAYSIDLFDVLKTSGDLLKIDQYSVAELEPQVRWNIETGDQGDYRDTYGESPAEVPVMESGAYLVTATVTTPTGTIAVDRQLILVSRLSLIAKGASDKAVCFTVDSITGRPRAGTTLFVQRSLNPFDDRSPEYRRSKSKHQYDQYAVAATGLTELSRPATTAEFKSHSLGTVIARCGRDYAILLDAPRAPDRWSPLQRQDQ